MEYGGAVRLVVALGGAVFAAVTFTSCLSGNSGGGETTPASFHPSAAVKQAYVEQLEQDYPSAPTIPSGDLVNLGTDLCADLANGLSVQHEALTMGKGGAPPDLVSAVFVDGTHYFCPSETAKVKKYVGLS